jgi:integrase/recombinase XerD
MNTIVLDTIMHKGNQVLLLKFPYDNELLPLVKQLPNATWTRTHKAWYTAYSTEVLHQVKALFEGHALIDASVLKESLNKLKNSSATIGSNKLAGEVETKIEQFKNWMRSKRYSDSTIVTYTDALTLFLKFYANKPIQEITNEDVIKFNNEYILKNKLSSSYQNQLVNAIKLFFRTVQNTTIDVNLIHRPKRERVLPNVLSKEEVKAILDAPQFLKHKAMLSLIYSCGLRCGELLRLKPEHIDSNRNILIIKQAKGRKDRIAPLSDKTIKLLRSYFKAFKPSVHLFEGEKEGTPYNERSLQLVLKQCALKAGINKPVTLHWLRHSYATHLLENGTDLRYIQEILGHSSSKTTEIYTHVSTKSIQKIVSPFDSL